MCNAQYLYIINKTYNPVTSRALLKKYQSLSEKRNVLYYLDTKKTP